MIRQHQFSQKLKRIVGTALVALGFAILSGRLDAPAAQLTSLLGLAAKATFEVLPSLGFAFGHQWLSPCPIQMLVSSWPLLHVMAGVV